jgi:hypothetical protein
VHHTFPLASQWQVRLVLPDDMMGLHALTGGLSNAGSAQERFLHAVGEQPARSVLCRQCAICTMHATSTVTADTAPGARAAVVALVNGELVGALAASPCRTADLDSWRAAFRLQTLPSGVLDSAGQHARLELCVVNPVFVACTGALLAGEGQCVDVHDHPG